MPITSRCTKNQVGAAELLPSLAGYKNGNHTFAEVQQNSQRNADAHRVAEAIQRLGIDGIGINRMGWTGRAPWSLQQTSSVGSKVALILLFRDVSVLHDVPQ